MLMVELQAKKNDNHLMISQNYLLGLSFFFMAVGLLWGVRYVAGYRDNGVRSWWATNFELLRGKC